MVKALWVLKLPQDSNILVSQGDKVSKGDTLAKKEEKIFTSPAEGEVLKTGNNKIEIQFKAEKIKGKGIGGKHQWGQLCYNEVDFSSLDESYQNKVILTRATDRLFLVKAKTLGVKGIICYSLNAEESSIDEQCPLVLSIEEDDIVLTKLKKANGIVCLLDATNNCLLIPK